MASLDKKIRQTNSHDLSEMRNLKRLFHFFQTVCIRLLWLLVRTYQLVISPVLGAHCRFYPSCSHYCQEALIEHGVFKGLFLTTKRICRCHPGHPGGFDPVPKKSCQSNG